MSDKRREFYVWPKFENGCPFGGQILSEQDFNTAINPECLERSFKAVELQPHERIFTRAEINDILSVFQVQQEYRHKILNELFGEVKDE